ncbi:AlpA family transcriptional regulator [Pantoea sp. JK]|uniref:AlpA family transcriptional regulator n=1 Tax=Pantoea sp. JK TaxID=2871703 RepID=UPI002238BA58|nr:AlpA family transcriptional regulator [Pantoea sp. JK]MCW6032427.1 AlpA family transcriptional regulator [Pantoea sp. JK]
MTVSNVKVLRLTQLMCKISVSRSTIYDWLNPKSPRYDANFPKQLRMGRQAVGWVESEIDAWLLNSCIRVNKPE